MALLASACGAAQPSSSRDDLAGLAFTRNDENGEHPSVWVADADGSNASRLATDAWGGTLSPDGRQVLYSASGGPDDERAKLYVQAVAGGKQRVLGKAVWGEWSPDSEHVVLSEAESLTFVDVDSGKRTELTHGGTGRWRSTSFSPDGKALAFARDDGRPGHEDESDIYVVRLSDGKTERLTIDGHSDYPVWGPDWIAFRPFEFINDEHWPSFGELWLMRPDGSGKHFLARGDEDPSMAHYGLQPLEFSADGKRLLGCYTYEFSCPPVTFSVPDGKRYEPSIGGKPLTASDLSRDGTAILVNTGAAEGPYDVYSIPFEGGPARLLAKQAVDASWAGR